MPITRGPRVRQRILQTAHVRFLFAEQRIRILRARFCREFRIECVLEEGRNLAVSLFDVASSVFNRASSAGVRLSLASNMPYSRLNPMRASAVFSGVANSVCAVCCAAVSFSGSTFADGSSAAPRTTSFSSCSLRRSRTCSASPSRPVCTAALPIRDTLPTSIS